MAIAIAVLALCAFVIKRRAAGRFGAGSLLRPRASARMPRTGLRVISRQALGKGAWLAIVEWEGREVLVGITNAGISFYDADGTGSLPRSQESADPDAAVAVGVDAAMARGRSSLLDPLRDLTVRR